MDEVIEKVKKRKQDKTLAKGYLVFYVSVGALPPYKAEAYIERYKEKIIGELMETLPDDIKTLWIPTRQNDSYVEFVSIQP